MRDQNSCLPGRKPLVRRPKAGEEIWRIYVTHVFWSCELRDHGKWSVEAQILRGGDLFIARRFDVRESAVRWADEQRQHIENGFPD